MWGLIGLSILLLLSELAFEDTFAALPVLGLLDNALLWLFVVELLLRVGSYRPAELDIFAYNRARWARAQILGRVRYCLNPLTLIDIATVLALVPALRGLRALRLLRLLRSPVLFRRLTPLSGSIQAFRDNGLLFTLAFGILGVTTITGGLSLFLLERKVNPAISDMADGMWWALVTITTVGFGDIAPVTPVGRLLAAVLMVGGMFTLALFAGVVGSTLLSAILSIQEEQFRMSHTADHVIIVGYDPGARMLLDAILTEVDTERHELVLFSDRERPPGLPPAFRWVRGDATKESEMGKVRLALASAVVLVGSRELSPQAADARTILTAFTIRSYLSKQTSKRKAAVYMVAEILDSENVAHARTAGADEVIETTRLGFSLISHALQQRGSADVLSLISTPGAQSLYLGEEPDEVDLPAPFHQVAIQIKELTGALLIGLHDPRTGKVFLNPTTNTIVERAHVLIYLAQAPIPHDEPPPP